MAGLLLPQLSNAQIVRIPFAMGAAQVTAQTFEFGDVQLGQYVTTTFTYKNGSPLDLTILGTTSDNVDLIGSDCPTTLAGQELCHITIGMLVLEEGLNQGQVRIKNDQNVQEDLLIVTASGVTTGNTVTINPAMQLYSIVNQEQEFTVTNNQVYDVNVSNVLMSNNYWTISKNACVGNLTAGNSCKVTAKYVNKKAGGYTGILKIISQSVMVGSSNLSGNTALGVPSFSSEGITAQDLNLNEVYQNSVTLKNSGVGGMIINSVGLDAPTNAFSMSSNSCSGRTLAPNETCSVAFQIMFTAPDVLQRSLIFNLSNSSTSAAYLNVYASAVASTSILNVLPGSLSFAAQSKSATSAPQSLALQSIGNAPVKITDMYITGKDAAMFSITNKASCIGDLSPGMQCALNLTYGPSNALGTHNATLNFTSDATTPTNSVALVGVSIAPTLSASPSKVTFTGNVGLEYFQTVAITNNSSIATVLNTILSSDSNIITTGSTCLTGMTLNAGESCSLKITLKNTAPIGSQTANITLNHSGDALAVGADYTLSALKIDPVVSEITCPTVSRSINATGTAVAANNADQCVVSIKNPSSSMPIYVPVGGISKVTGASAFSAVATGLTSAATIAPNATSTFKIPYQVSASVGGYSADYSITTSTNLSVPANSSVIQKTASATVVDGTFELSGISCPASVSLGSAVTCTARVSNKSLSSYSLLVPYTSKNLVYAAPKFSETLLDGALLSTAIVDRPVDDYSPTATNFRWATSVTGCSAGSAAAVGVANSGYCDLSIVFNPTKIGAYTVPLYGLFGSSTASAFKGASNALFSVVETATGNLSNVTCPSLTVGSSAVCTATLTNPSSQAVLAVTNASIAPNASGTFSAATHNCGSSLAASANCTVSIPVTGVTAGAFNTTLTVNTSAGAYTANAAITVGLATPSVSISAFSCPSVIEDQPTTCTTTLKNNGSLAYNISGIVLAKTNIGFSAPTSSASVLAPGDSAVISIPFVNAVAATYTTNVSVQATGFTDLGTTATVIVSPSPAAVGTLSPLTCASLSFSQSGLCTATVKNTSAIKPLAISSVSTTGNASVFGTYSSACGTSIPANGSCVITVPVSGTLVGAYPLTLSVVTNPSLSQNTTVTVNPLVFSVTAAPTANTISGSPVTLKTTFFNKNTFNVSLPLGAVTLAGTGYKITSNACDNTTLPPDQGCAVDVSYTGSLTGLYKGSLTLKYGGATVVGDLSTTVISPSLTVVPLDSLTTKASGFRSLSGNWYVVTNSNPVPLTIASISMANVASAVIANQSVAGSCYPTQTLQPYEQCLVFERFNVSSMGTSSSVSNSNTGTVKSSTGVTGVWSSNFQTQRGTLSINKAAVTLAPNDSYTGSVTFTNSSASAVKGLIFTRTSDTTLGTLTMTAGNCTGIIAAGATCTQSFDIQGIPAGALSVGINLQGIYQAINNDRVSADWGELTTIVASPARVTITGTAPTGQLTTGSYGNGLTATSLFTNKSVFPVTVTNVVVTGATDQSLSGSTCNNEIIPANGTCEITTSRQLQAGDLDTVRTPATITVTVNTQYPFSGTIVSSPVLSNAINFGEVNVGSTSSRTLTVQNTTSGTLTFTSIVLPANVTRISTVAGDCPTTTTFTLATGQKCLMRLAWKPLIEGAFLDQMSINSNYGGSSTATVSLSGNAIVPVGTLTAMGGGCGQPHTFMDVVNNELIDGVHGWFLGLDSRYTTSGNAFIYGLNVNTVGTGCTQVGTTVDLFQTPPSNLKIYQTYARSTTQESIVYNSTFDSYIIVGYLANTNGVNPNTLGAYPLMNYMVSKPRSGVTRSYYYNNALNTGGPLGVVTYYNRLRLFSSYDNTLSLVSMVSGNTMRFFQVDLNNSYGLSEITATPYYADTPIANVPASQFVYTLTSSGGGMFMDGSNPYVFWVYSNIYGVFTYNTQNGAISFKHDKSKASTFANVRTMDTQGFMYAMPGYTNTSPTSYIIRKIDSTTAVSTNIGSLPATLANGNYAMPYGMFLSRDQRYLFMTGNLFRYKLKIRQ